MRSAQFESRENRLDNATMSGSPRVELVYDLACPNIEQARDAIRSAMVAAGVQPIWKEWLSEDPNTPTQLQHLGSASVLVNGHDVGGDDQAAADAGANSCRLYKDECGCLRGAPPAELILELISRTR